MITVRLKLSGLMAKYYKTSPRAKMESAELSDNATVTDLVDYYEIPREKVHLVVVNRERGEMDTVLRDGDEVWLLPLAHGG
ncbi:MAG TPA: hypothetical protein ENN21_00365 [Spirochaetes bacterium]|nr:hypothetical protein [Spirochaetota bacterium]